MILELWDSPVLDCDDGWFEEESDNDALESNEQNEEKVSDVE